VNLWQWPRRSRDQGRRQTSADPADAVAEVAAGLSVPTLSFIGTPGSARELWAFHAPANHLVPWWRRLRAAHSATGLWPVILGSEIQLEEIWDSGGDPHEAVSAGLAMDAAARLAEIQADMTAEYEEWSDPGQVWPPRGDATGMTVHDEDDFYLAKEDGWIGLISAQHGYLVPGLLTWTGAANHALEPSDHVAILKYWHERHGAELVTLGWDVLELLVSQPPADPRTAMAVAEEQWWYCPDIVDQGVQTLDALAAIQVCGKRWFFWWD